VRRFREYRKIFFLVRLPHRALKLESPSLGFIYRLSWDLIVARLVLRRTNVLPDVSGEAEILSETEFSIRET
jgi:hypothetical protein